MTSGSRTKLTLLGLLSVLLIGLTSACGIPIEEDVYSRTSDNVPDLVFETKPSPKAKKVPKPTTKVTTKATTKKPKPVETPRQKFVKWLKVNNVKTWLDRQNDAYRGLATASDNADLPGAVAACRALKKNTRKAQAWPSAPDAKYESLQDSTLKHAAKAAQYCISGLENSDLALIDKTDPELALSASGMKNLGVRFEQILGRQ